MKLIDQTIQYHNKPPGRPGFASAPLRKKAEKGEKLRDNASPKRAHVEAISSQEISVRGSVEVHDIPLPFVLRTCSRSRSEEVRFELFYVFGRVELARDFLPCPGGELLP